MSKCPICKYTKCRWVDLDDDPKKLTTQQLDQVVNHNIGVIDMLCRNNNGSNGSAYAEERMYNRLTPYADELEARRSDREAK